MSLARGKLQTYKEYLQGVVSVNWGVLVVDVLAIKVLLFGVYIRAPRLLDSLGDLEKDFLARFVGYRVACNCKNSLLKCSIVACSVARSFIGGSGTIAFDTTTIAGLNVGTLMSMGRPLDPVILL